MMARASLKLDCSPAAAPMSCGVGISEPRAIRWSRGAPIAVLAAATAAAAACASDPAPAPGWIERDSAGITIVENTTAEWTDATGWRVDSIPALDLGRADGDPAYMFHRLRPVRRLRDGRIAVPSSGNAEIRIFSASGEHQRTIGRRGDGPGEFFGLWWIDELPGDSILAFDLGHDRITVFGPDGEHARDHRFERPEGAFEPSLLGRFDDGRILGYGGGGEGNVPAAAPGFTRSQSTYFTVDETGGDPQIVGDFVEQTGSGRGILWFGPRARSAVHGDSWYFAPGEPFEIRVHDAEGELRRIFRIDEQPRSITEQEREAYLDSIDDYVERTPSLRQRLANSEIYPIVPPVGGIIVDANGALWIAPYVGQFGFTSAGSWTVLNSDGHLLGMIEMPAGVTVDQIGDDFVLGRWTDEFDVEHVRIYPLHKTRRRMK